MRPNPINSAMDRLVFTTDMEEMCRLLAAGEHWVVWGVRMNEGVREWMLGRISTERIRSLPDFLPLYEGDFVTTLREMIRNGVPVDPHEPIIPYLLKAANQ